MMKPFRRRGRRVVSTAAVPRAAVLIVVVFDRDPVQVPRSSIDD